MSAAAAVRGWLPVIDPGPSAPPGVEDNVNTALGYLMWAGGVVCFVSLATIGLIFFLNATGRIGGQGAANGGSQAVCAGIVGRLGWVVLGAGILGGASGIGYALTGV